MSTDSKLKEYEIKYAGEMLGHNGWVTSISSTADPNIIVSASRDKTLIVWRLLGDQDQFGRPEKRFYGHQHFIQDVAVSSDGRFALSGSWDRTLRLWDLETRQCSATFNHHKGDVLSVSFSADNRQICSGSRDRTVALWNTLGQHNFTISDQDAPDWISHVVFSPKVSQPEKSEGPEGSLGEEENSSLKGVPETPSSLASVTAGEKKPVETEGKPSGLSGDKNSLNFLVYASWNGTIKKFDLDENEVALTLEGHDGPVTALAVSPDASLFASGGKDGKVMLWEVASGMQLRELEMGGPVVSLKFNPGAYWLCGVSEDAVKVWDLLRGDQELMVCGSDFSAGGMKCTSVEWARDGATLLCGFTDGVIRALRVVEVTHGDGELE